MQQLALDTQSFEKLRKGKYLYVDKTEVIYKMITSGRIYFLSRPRRFGKSLLVSTLEALFRGKKELFEGLYLYDKWEWEEYPVITIDWAGINHSTPEEMKESLVLYLKKIAQNYQVILEAKSAVDYFRDLIEALQEKTGKDVVILIDEYDKPNNLGRSDAVWEQSGLTVIAKIKYFLLSLVGKVKKRFAEKKIDTLLDEALKQIHDRRYYNKYSGKCASSGHCLLWKTTRLQNGRVKTNMKKMNNNKI
jgi:hypothetical protein